jgi:hypothetical protein
MTLAAGPGSILLQRDDDGYEAAQAALAMLDACPVRDRATVTLPAQYDPEGRFLSYLLPTGQ